MMRSVDDACFDLMRQVLEHPTIGQIVGHELVLCEDGLTCMAYLHFGSEVSLASSFDLPRGVSFDHEHWEERFVASFHCGGTLH